MSSPRPQETVATTPRPLADDLHWLLVVLARGLGAVEERVVRRHSLSLRAYVALSEIARSPARSQLAISRAIRVLDPSSLVGVLDELEAAGFVTRVPDPADRRVRIVTATPAGLSALIAANADVEQAEDELLCEVPAHTREQVYQALRQAATSALAAPLDNSQCPAG
jgi:DNA-binding MarR family transcriptional regulator